MNVRRHRIFIARLPRSTVWRTLHLSEEPVEQRDTARRRLLPTLGAVVARVRPARGAMRPSRAAIRSRRRLLPGDRSRDAAVGIVLGSALQ